MLIPAIIFTKIPLSESSSKILFCLVQDKLVEFDLVNSSPSNFAAENNLTRHDKFDWHVNKSKPICYFFESQIQRENIKVFDTQIQVQWFIFPHAIKKLSNGTHRNLLQLAVQYISYGMIDESVIAADIDEEWVKSNID